MKRIRLKQLSALAAMEMSTGWLAGAAVLAGCSALQGWNFARELALEKQQIAQWNTFPDGFFICLQHSGFGNILNGGFCFSFCCCAAFGAVWAADPHGSSGDGFLFRPLKRLRPRRGLILCGCRAFGVYSCSRCLAVGWLTAVSCLCGNMANCHGLFSNLPSCVNGSRWHVRCSWRVYCLLCWQRPSSAPDWNGAAGDVSDLWTRWMWDV